MAKDIKKKIEKLNDKVDNLVKKYKKLNDSRKKKKDKVFIDKVVDYYSKFDDEDAFFAALELASAKNKKSKN